MQRFASVPRLLLGPVLIFILVRGEVIIDDTVKPEAKGADVVEAVCRRLATSNVFPEDNLLLRRLAYVESTDGVDTKAFRPNYYGGIWQVDRVMFDALRSSSAETHLKTTFARVRSVFGINWKLVAWQDLTKPLYSALAGRMYLHYQSRQFSNPIPQNVADQATFWQKYYRRNGKISEFLTAADQLAKVDLLQYTTEAPVTEAPNIYPDPYVTMKLNGTLFTTDYMDVPCSDSYLFEFRRSFEDAITRANDAIVNEQLCLDSGGELRAVAGSIQFAAIGMEARISFTAMVGLDPSDAVTIRDDELCAWDVNLFLQDMDNWRQPIIPTVSGCPSTTWNPPLYHLVKEEWSCF